MGTGLDSDNRVADVSTVVRLRQRAGAGVWHPPWLRGGLTLSPPLAWFLVVYLASLVVMLITPFFSVNSLTGNVQYQWTWSNFSQIFTQSVYGVIILRTVLMAVAVTVTDALVALPFAFFLAKIAGRRWRQLLLAAERAGVSQRPSETDFEYAGWLEDQIPARRPEIRPVAEGKVWGSYSGRGMGVETVARMEGAWRRLRRPLTWLAVRRRLRSLLPHRSAG